MFRWFAAIWWMRWGMLMSDAELLPSFEPRLWCFAVGDSEDGSPVVALGVKRYVQQTDANQYNFKGQNRGSQDD